MAEAIAASPSAGRPGRKTVLGFELDFWDYATFVTDGRGDIAAANLTITPERRKQVDFSTPPMKNVSELVVTGPKSPPIASVDDLSGKEVFVRRSSHYYTHLEQLNQRLRSEGKRPSRLRLAPEQIATEGNLIKLRSAQRANRVRLYQVLGGSFEATPAATLQAPAEASRVSSGN